MTSTYQANLLTPDTEYNGWTNYETWNAALWIGSDQGLYEIARRAMDWEHPVSYTHLTLPTTR